MRRTYTAREPIVASVLTDLALIRDRRPSTAREIDRLAAELVVTGSTGSGTADNTQTPRGMSPRRPTLIKLHVNLDPGHPEFQIDKSRGLDPNKDRVSAQWYYRGAGIPFWTALSSVSGPVEDDVNFVSTPYYTSPAYLAGTTPPQCLPQGTYRVDVYANGRFAGRAEAHTDWSGVKPIRLRDLGVGTCVEQQLRPLKQGIRSAVRVFLGPGGKTGMAVIALPPVLAAGSSVSSLARLAVHSFAPGTGLFRRLKLTSEASVNFMNLKSPEMQNWAYSGGNLVVGAGRAPDGRAYVAMAWAPDDGTRGTRTIFSFSQF
jgi:hypothetical protein